MDKNVPKLRFKGFEDEWKEKNLGALGSFLKGNGLSKADLSESGQECILYGELYTKYNEVISNVKSKTNIESKNAIMSKSNDVIIPSSGETAIDIATASCVKKDNVILGGDLNIFRPSDINGVFISYQLNNSQKKEIAKIAQGASVVHVYNEQLKKVKVKFPIVQEQEKIANFLTKVDGYIEKQDEKVKELNLYKKGMMQKIFLQEIRFKDENGCEYVQWEEKKLGCVADIGTGSNDLQDKVENGEYPFFVRSAKVEKIDRYTFDGEAILIPGDGNIGQIYHYINGKFAYHQRVYKISDFTSNILGKYVYFYMNKYFLKEALKNSVKATVDSLRLPTLTGMFIQLPCLEEQIKIAKFLSNIDNIIEKENKKLEELRLWKKGLLQQMFV